MPGRRRWQFFPASRPGEGAERHLPCPGLAIQRPGCIPFNSRPLSPRCVLQHVLSTALSARRHFAASVREHSGSRPWGAPGAAMAHPRAFTDGRRRRGASGTLAVLAAAAALVACYSGAGVSAWAQASAEAASRRALLGGAMLWAAVPGASGAAGEKVVVLGGSGFVGRRVCERLAEGGAAVTSISRSGSPPPGAGAWAAKVTWLKGDATSMDLGPAFAGADAVVSAIGAIGSADDETTNGLTAERAAAAAAAAKVGRFVLVSATQLVADAGMGSVFPGYVAGKRRAEAAVASFPGQTLVLQPHGGGFSAAKNSARPLRGLLSGTGSRSRTC
ncbi:unnamed protein product [Prorocentrum cordatum]|uniref:NAD(P)-binding domain-containing protein n=1 Tax=Prorocentrum cordatum TaxID=2364126 RepID=A0ABN9T6F1_9DINO|nr:unnamed protein product [Polarella glacialis]